MKQDDTKINLLPSTPEIQNYYVTIWKKQRVIGGGGKKRYVNGTIG